MSMLLPLAAGIVVLLASHFAEAKHAKARRKESAPRTSRGAGLEPAVPQGAAPPVAPTPLPPTEPVADPEAPPEPVPEPEQPPDPVPSPEPPAEPIPVSEPPPEPDAEPAPDRTDGAPPAGPQTAAIRLSDLTIRPGLRPEFNDTGRWRFPRLADQRGTVFLCGLTAVLAVLLVDLRPTPILTDGPPIQHQPFVDAPLPPETDRTTESPSNRNADRSGDPSTLEPEVQPQPALHRTAAPAPEPALATDPPARESPQTDPPATAPLDGAAEMPMPRSRAVSGSWLDRPAVSAAPDRAALKRFLAALTHPQPAARTDGPTEPMEAQTRQAAAADQTARHVHPLEPGLEPGPDPGRATLGAPRNLPDSHARAGHLAAPEYALDGGNGPRSGGPIGVARAPAPTKEPDLAGARSTPEKVVAPEVPADRHAGKPSPTDAPSRRRRGGYRVQVGSFLFPRHATEAERALHHAGFAPYRVRWRDAQHVLWHVVRLRGFDSLPSALAVARIVKDQTGYAPIVLD